MPTPVPTLGYPSKVAAAKGLRAKGLKWREVAELMGVSVDRARAMAGEQNIRSDFKHTIERDPQGPFIYAPKRPSSIQDEIREAWERAQAKKFARFSTLSTPSTDAPRGPQQSA